MQHDFILLDRSGSMEPLWIEAINSVNDYVKKLADQNVDTGVTLAVFDGHDGLSFDVVRDRIIPSTWKPVDPKEVSPRGMTPLNDATAKIVGLANAGINGTPYEKVAIIIMTDGHENASRELTVAQAKKLLDDCRAKGWQVIFLGANFDNAAQAASYGTQATQTIASSAKNLRATMDATASLRASYATGRTRGMEYSAEQKHKAAQQ